MEVRNVSFLEKMKNSFIGVIIGLVLFFGSFVLLFVNEGRENLGKVAATAKEVIAADAKVDESKLICMTGVLDAEYYATDIYLVDFQYLYISRVVEMYAYREIEEESSKDNFGGSTTITTTYKYEKAWTSNPKDTSTYKGDSSEKPTIPDASAYNERISSMSPSMSDRASGFFIGSVKVSGSVTLHGDEALTLTAENVNISNIEYAKIEEDYILDGVGASPSLASPALGDIRISYRVTPVKEGIIFGVFSGSNQISGFSTKKGNVLFQFFPGVTTKAAAKNILIKEHRAIAWLLRFVGFLMMFLGLMGLTGPITKFLSIIPIFSKVTGWIFAVAAFVVAFALTTITSLLAAIFHNIWLTIIFVLLIAGGIVFFIMKKRKEAETKGTQFTKEEQIAEQTEDQN